MYDLREVGENVVIYVLHFTLVDQTKKTGGRRRLYFGKEHTREREREREMGVGGIGPDQNS